MPGMRNMVLRTEGGERQSRGRVKDALWTEIRIPDILTTMRKTKCPTEWEHAWKQSARLQGE